jgi:crotonobetainyl-CoA:carnitine CoA-transferase CaiB-like acyl-CoA transferase
LSLDPQLKHRQYFWEVDHPVIGQHKFDAEAFELPESPRRLRMAAPLIGQHNEQICTQILGMSDEEFVELLNEGVFE